MAKALWLLDARPHGCRGTEGAARRVGAEGAGLEGGGGLGRDFSVNEVKGCGHDVITLHKALAPKT